MAKRSSNTKARNDGVSTLFHSLPVEVVIEILAFASLLSTETALSICLVASWTKALGLAGLYGLVVLSNSRHLRTFVKAVGYSRECRIYEGWDGMEDIVKNLMNKLDDLTSSSSSVSLKGRKAPVDRKQRPDLLRMVHSLWLPAEKYFNNDLSILADSKNISNMAIPSFFLQDLLENTFGACGLRHLMLTTSAFRYDWREASLTGNHALRNLTHLFISTAEENSCFVPIDNLPSLAHVALPLVIADGYKPTAFAEFSVAASLIPYERLQMILIHYKEKSMRKLLPRCVAERLIVSANAFNSRLYAIPLNRRSEIKGLWKSAARGRESVWTDAKVVLRHAKHALLEG